MAFQISLRVYVNKKVEDHSVYRQNRGISRRSFITKTLKDLKVPSLSTVLHMRVSASISSAFWACFTMSLPTCIYSNHLYLFSCLTQFSRSVMSDSL